MLFDIIVHKALASRTRREILISLSKNGKYLTEIANEIGKKPQSINFHLKLLSNIGLVYSDLKDGKRYYFLKNKEILKFLKKREPVPEISRPKLPYEIILEVLNDIKTCLDRIEKKIDILVSK